VSANFSSVVIIPVASTSGLALDSKQICEYLHVDADSFSEISQDADIDITECIYPHAEVNRPLHCFL
jgi:hypothetical protein